MAGRERLVAVFDAMDPVTASDWLQTLKLVDGMSGKIRTGH